MNACESGISPGGLTSGATAVSVEAIGVSVPVVVVVAAVDDAVVSACVVSFFAVQATPSVISRIGMSFRIRVWSLAKNSSNFGATKLNSGKETERNINGNVHHALV